MATPEPGPATPPPTDTHRAGSAGREHDVALAPLLEQVTAAAGAPVAGSPADDGALGMLVQVVGLRPAPGTGTPTRLVATADVVLDVLVTAVGGQPGERSARVTDVALALLADGTWPVRPGGPPESVWAALGLTVRPGLLLEVPVRRVLDRPLAPPVRERLRVAVRPRSAS